MGSEPPGMSIWSDHPARLQHSPNKHFVTFLGNIYSPRSTYHLHTCCRAVTVHSYHLEELGGTVSLGGLLLLSHLSYVDYHPPGGLLYHVTISTLRFDTVDIRQGGDIRGVDAFHFSGGHVPFGCAGKPRLSGTRAGHFIAASSSAFHHHSSTCCCPFGANVPT